MDSRPATLTWSAFAETMLLLGGFITLLMAGALANTDGRHLTGMGLVIAGLTMMMAASLAPTLRRGVTGAVWIGGASLVIGLGTGATSRTGDGAGVFVEAVGIAITVLFGAALYGAVRSGSADTWARPTSIAACGAAVLAWMVLLAERGVPSWASLLIGGLCAALVVAQFLSLRQNFDDDDPVWLATHVLVLVFGMLGTRGRATHTPSPKIGAFRKL